MPFGLTNGPATWQHFINDTFFDHLEKFLAIYVDDILIYSRTRAEHEQHVNMVLQRLSDAGLQIDIDKSEFYVQETKFLGMIIGVDGIRMDPVKVEAILNWEEPKTIKEVQAFLGVCNFYQRFVEGFANIARPLTQLTRKDTPWKFRKEIEGEAFNLLKKRLSSAPVLAHFNRSLPTRVETDVSDYCAGEILTQLGADGQWHPVAYFSKNLAPAECNYQIYDKELLAIIKGLETWEPELTTLDGNLEFVTDHKGLEYFATSRRLSRRQAR